MFDKPTEKDGLIVPLRLRPLARDNGRLCDGFYLMPYQKRDC